jgi:hypothetical protein
MAECDICGDDVNMPYECNRCGGTFCGEHRLPESHDCPALEWGDPKSAHFESGFDASVSSDTSSRSLLDRLPIDTGVGGPLAYFRGNLTFTFLILIWITFALQLAVLLLIGGETHNFLFTLRTNYPQYVWTWFTSIFAHDPGGIAHIAFNSIALYFFGPLVERKTGSKAFAVLFLVSGALAGLGQIVLGLALGQSGAVLGASGAIMAVMGVLTILNPDLRVLLFFFIPMPLWLLTGGFALYSIFAAGTGALGNVAHTAHLVGLVIGLVYGQHLKKHGVSAPSQLQMGGGRRRGPGGPGGPGGRF